MSTQSPPHATWIDLTLRVHSDADVEIEAQPNGDIEYTIPVPECPSSKVTFIIPAEVARKINGKVRELLASVPAVAAVLITG